MYLLSSVESVLPFFVILAMFGVVGLGVYKALNALFGQTISPRSNAYKHTNINRNYSQSQVKSNQSTSYVKNAKNEEIDKVMSKYFKKNVSLVLFDDISIDLQGGSYTTVDNLYISYKGEKISQLKEYKSY